MKRIHSFNFDFDKQDVEQEVEYQDPWILKYQSRGKVDTQFIQVEVKIASTPTTNTVPHDHPSKHEDTLKISAGHCYRHGLSDILRVL